MASAPANGEAVNDAFGDAMGAFAAADAAKAEAAAAEAADTAATAAPTAAAGAGASVRGSCGGATVASVANGAAANEAAANGAAVSIAADCECPSLSEAEGDEERPVRSHSFSWRSESSCLRKTWADSRSSPVAVAEPLVEAAAEPASWDTEGPKASRGEFVAAGRGQG